MMKLLIINICVLIFILISCKNEESSEELIIDEKEIIECDSTFTELIEISQFDSVQMSLGWYYFPWDFVSYEFKNDSIIKTKINIISTFHDSIEISRVWNQCGLDSIYSNEEIEAYKVQNLEIDSECYPEYDFITRDSLNKLHDWNRKNNYELRIKYYSFSKPLISNDRNYALMQLESNRGPMDASAHTYLFQMSNGTWNICWRFCRWVS